MASIATANGGLARLLTISIGPYPYSPSVWDISRNRLAHVVGHRPCPLRFARASLSSKAAAAAAAAAASVPASSPRHFSRRNLKYSSFATTEMDLAKRKEYSKSFRSLFRPLYYSSTAAAAGASPLSYPFDRGDGADADADADAPVRGDGGAGGRITAPRDINPSSPQRIRLSKLIASYGLNVQTSRRSAERLIEDGLVTVAGAVVRDRGYQLTMEEASAGGGVVKVSGRRLLLPIAPPVGGSGGGGVVSIGDGDVGGRSSLPGVSPSSSVPKTATIIPTRVWLAHKLIREVVTENDPHGRPSLIERLRRGGVGKIRRRRKSSSSSSSSSSANAAVHLKPIGRLDMMTEGLVVLTNDGRYARDMELPSNGMHRTYRARVHGRVTSGKLDAIRRGTVLDGVSYRGMKVNIEATGGGMRRRERSSNTWLRITCAEGKNRQVRKVLAALGLTVTRLIRTSFGDYNLDTVPPGMAIEVPVKPVSTQRRKGVMRLGGGRRNGATRREPVEIEGEKVRPVEWIRH